MGLIGVIHGSMVHGRRVRVLGDHLARLLPASARVLDIGCGDGRLARHVMQLREDVRIEGIDVLVRPEAQIHVEPFDGMSVPAAGDSYDAAMFIDVLHHAGDPMALLREARRVARRVVIKDHLRQGLLAGPTLRLMDWVGNAPHGVALTYDYWTEQRWREAFDALGLEITLWKTRLGLYPWPATWAFERSMHFLAVLEGRS